MYYSSSGIEFTIFFSGKLSPIVPVEANKRLFILIFFGCSSSLICFLDNSSDNREAILLIDLYPSFPVNALAFLVFTKRAYIFSLVLSKFHFIFSDLIFD